MLSLISVRRRGYDEWSYTSTHPIQFNSVHMDKLALFIYVFKDAIGILDYRASIVRITAE
jgi:hypothetical protein